MQMQSQTTPAPQPTPSNTRHPLAGLVAHLERSRSAGVTTFRIVHGPGGKIIGWELVESHELHGYRAAERD